MAVQGGGGRFSALLLEGLDHYRKGKMLDAVRAWEEAYLLEPTNLRAREFLRSALERIHAVMAPAGRAPNAAAPHPWLPPKAAAASVAPAPAAAPGAGLRKATAAAVPKGQKAKPAAAPAQRPAPTPPAPPRSPWDDGPSVAIPQPESGDSGGGAWSLHADTLPN